MRGGPRRVVLQCVHETLTDRPPVASVRSTLARSRVEIPDLLGIQTEESSGDITASFDLSFTLTSQPDREPWVVHVDVSFDERDGEWLVVRSDFQPVSGRRPF